MEGNNDTSLPNFQQELPDPVNIPEESQNEYTDSDSIPPLVTDSESEDDSLLSQEDQPVFITETVAIAESAEEDEDPANSEHSEESEGSADSEDYSENNSEEEFEADETSVHCLSKVCIRRIGNRAKNHTFVVMKDKRPVFTSGCIYTAFNKYEQLFLEVVLDVMPNNRIVLDHSLDTMECIFRTDISLENRFFIISYIRPHSTFELYMI